MNEIKLPPMHFMLKAYCKDTQESIKTYARTAVELNSQERSEIDMEIVEEELRDMASSAYQVAMAFGVSQDSFERLARDVFDHARRRIEGEGK